MTNQKANKGRVCVDLFEKMKDLEALADLKKVEVSELAYMLLVDGIERLTNNRVASHADVTEPVISCVDVMNDKDFRPCKAHAANMEAVTAAFKADAACLMEVTLKATGERAAALCAVSQDEEGGAFSLSPFALMLNGDPYELLDPPVGIGS
jgi:hypothetical protein